MERDKIETNGYNDAAEVSACVRLGRGEESGERKPDGPRLIGSGMTKQAAKQSTHTISDRATCLMAGRDLVFSHNSEPQEKVRVHIRIFFKSPVK